jgi:hypothetical protein
MTLADARRRAISISRNASYSAKYYSREERSLEAALAAANEAATMLSIA